MGNPKRRIVVPAFVVILTAGAVRAAAQLPPPDYVVTAVETGGGHKCAVTTTGGVKCWGGNNYGQLGDGTTTPQSAPVDVVGLSTGVARVTTGAAHTCALTTSGAMKCWGQNFTGAVGDGSTTHRSIPVDVSGLTSGVAAITAGSNHTCAVTTSGSLKCWGDNSNGQLGDGTSGTHRPVPTDVVGLTSGVRDVAGGFYDTCALTAVGGVKCWGSASSSNTPVAVAGLSSGVILLALGQDHACAVNNGGGLKCWGGNIAGQLGDGTSIDRPAPVDVVGLGAGVSAVDAGVHYTCAVIEGAVKCWGRNESRQLGDGTTTARLTPTPVVGFAGGAAGISAGGTSTCASTLRGGVRCWGDSLTVPIDAPGLSSGIVSLTTGRFSTCVLSSGGEAKCWGSNFYGQLGDGTTVGPRTTAVDVTELPMGAATISGGAFHTCAVTRNGGAKCWGNNTYGQIGDGITGDRSTPVDVSGLTSGVANVAAGYYHTCALTTSGGVKCWGDNFYGALGDGTTNRRTTPVDVIGLTSGVAAIAAGGDSTCALTTAGGIKCWGFNAYGSLGDGGTVSRSLPADVFGLTSGIAEISVGLYHACARTTGGAAKCWGNNLDGQMGDGTTLQRNTPVDVFGLAGVASIAAGYYHACAATTSGTVRCWGYNGNGSVGDGTITTRTTPVSVSGPAVFASSVAAAYQSCALTSTGGVKCWGHNLFGSVGDGTTTNRLSPVSVIRSRQWVTLGTTPNLSVGVPMALSASSSAGLPITFDTWTPGTCSVSGNMVTATGTSLCGIRAFQAGNQDQAPAPHELGLVAVNPTTPTINSPVSTFVKPLSAILGGTVASDGGSAITGRGVVFSETSVNASPLIGGFGVSMATAAGSTGSFTIPATFLTPSTSYSFRAFATNVLGTSYSAIATFTTPAPAARVFVSSGGSDVNVCSDQLAPCRSLAEALAQVATDGEVIVLTPGEYETAPLTITKGVKVTSPSGTVAFVRQPITINAPGARVALRGLTLKGNDAGDGITLVAAGSLSVEETTIDRWVTGLKLGTGSGSFVSVTHSVFAANTVGVQLASGGTNGVSIEGARFEGNGTGLSISGGSFFVRESSFIGNVVAGATIDGGSADLRRSEFTLNGIGVNALSGGTVRLGRSVVFGNTTGLFAAGGSTFESSGTNVIRGNTTDTTGTITPIPEG